MVWDDVNARQIALLTNHRDFGATTISSIYKDRWQIELFFEALVEQSNINYNNTLVAREIGQVVNRYYVLDEVLSEIVRILEKTARL